MFGRKPKQPDQAPITIAERVDDQQAKRLKIGLEASGADFQIIEHP